MTDVKARIRALNDVARSAMGVASVAVQTAGVNALPLRTQSRVRELVETFNDFNAGNDPNGEHDFGSFHYEGQEFFWKIDYYDLNLEYGSETPEDPLQTRRVLTIMLAEEY